MAERSEAAVNWSGSSRARWTSSCASLLLVPRARTAVVVAGDSERLSARNGRDERVLKRELVLVARRERLRPEEVVVRGIDERRGRAELRPGPRHPHHHNRP